MESADIVMKLVSNFSRLCESPGFLDPHMIHVDLNKKKLKSKKRIINTILKNFDQLKKIYNSFINIESNDDLEPLVYNAIQEFNQEFIRLISLESELINSSENAKKSIDNKLSLKRDVKKVRIPYPAALELLRILEYAKNQSALLDLIQKEYRSLMAILKRQKVAGAQHLPVVSGSGRSRTDWANKIKDTLLSSLLSGQKKVSKKQLLKSLLDIPLSEAVYKSDSRIIRTVIDHRRYIYSSELFKDGIEVTFKASQKKIK